MPLTIVLSFAQVPQGQQLAVVYGVQTDAPQVFPTIWQLKSGMALKTQLTVPWNDTPQAYYSDAKCAPGVTLNDVTATPCSLGQTFQLGANQAITIQAEGPQGQLSMLNSSTSGWTFGCCLDTGNGAVPHFACALGVGNLIQAIPGPNLLLYFITGKANSGQIIGPSPYCQQTRTALPYSAIVCLNLPQLAQLTQPAALAYDSSGGGWQLPQPTPAWASIYPATSDIPTLAVLPLPDQSG